NRWRREAVIERSVGGGCGEGSGEGRRGLIAERGVWPRGVVQHDDRTPTVQRFASFCIRGIPGSDGWFTSMRCWLKMRLFSGAAFLALSLIGLLKFRPGCLTDR